MGNRARCGAGGSDEIELIDLPPDELLQRLKEGKVYLPQQAERAAQNFFRKGNLIALRELALRRTADRVDAQMRDYREDHAIQDVWQVKERMLVCIGPGGNAENLVRASYRLAQLLKAEWIVLYVETAKLQRLSREQRDAILRTLKLAEELGAETVTLGGDKLADEVISYARTRNATRIVLGKPSLVGVETLAVRFAGRHHRPPSQRHRHSCGGQGIQFPVADGGESLFLAQPLVSRTCIRGAEPAIQVARRLHVGGCCDGNLHRHSLAHV